MECKKKTIPSKAEEKQENKNNKTNQSTTQKESKNTI